MRFSQRAFLRRMYDDTMGTSKLCQITDFYLKESWRHNRHLMTDHCKVSLALVILCFLQQER